jgi:glycosyltransferase involved in cell wall biosynthesis
LKATAIIPAYNEESRIATVLRAVTAAACVGEVIVIDDGSQDRTAEIAATVPGVSVIRMARNRGKAAAMAQGAQRAANDVIVFLDADLVSLTTAHVDDLAGPVLECEVGMTVGQFWSGSPIVTAWMRFCPAISGQRAMHADDFLAIPDVAEAGYGVEVVVTRHALYNRLRIRYVHLPNITHVWKESKRGLARGVGMRASMYGQILRWSIGTRYHHLRDSVRDLLES